MAETASNLIAIGGMAGVTLACRCGGYALFSRIRRSPFLARAMAHLPGCIFIAYVAPKLASGSPAIWLGALVTVIVMAASRNLGAAIAAGVAAVWGAGALL